MKVHILGIEVSEGISKKTGKPYSMGSLHTFIPLAPPFGENNIAKGAMGSTYECDPVLLRKLEHLPFPVQAEVEFGAQMRFGERTEVVVDVRPLEVVTKKAA